MYLFANIGTLQCSLEKRFSELFRVGCINERVQTWSMFSFLDMPEEELLAEANKWELSHGGLSGRTA